MSGATVAVHPAAVVNPLAVVIRGVRHVSDLLYRSYPARRPAGIRA